MRLPLLALLALVTSNAALAAPPAALERITTEAQSTHSDALILIRNGQTEVESYFGKSPTLTNTQSITKSIASLAIGLLISDGRIATIDAPLSRWYPQWAYGDRITLRHVLTHTTGLRDDAGWARAPDRLAFALGRTPVTPPGAVFSYSNVAVQLLSGIVEKETGQPIDAFVESRLFAPLGITHWRWGRDAAGNPTIAGGLALLLADLAKIGVGLLNGGPWIDVSTSIGEPANPCYGLLWWLVRDPYTPPANLGTCPASSAPPLAFAAYGWGGQYLVVDRRNQAVAVRLRAFTEGGTSAENARYGYAAFPRDVAAWAVH